MIVDWCCVSFPGPFGRMASASRKLKSRQGGFLVAVIGDEDTTTGFLLAGVGENDANAGSNYFVVDAKETSADAIEEAFKKFTEREDIAIVLINQYVSFCSFGFLLFSSLPRYVYTIVVVPPTSSSFALTEKIGATLFASVFAWFLFAAFILSAFLLCRFSFFLRFCFVSDRRSHPADRCEV